MLVVCTTDELEGETMEAHRETDVWFECDVSIYGEYALMILPKTCWRRVEELVVPIT
jgi:hypothetical protein